MKAAREFLKAIVDYAGLFPPASLSMADAVRAYSTYRRSNESDLLGRFILPVSRLVEFSAAMTTLATLDEASGIWRLSVIAAPENDDHAAQITEFNRSSSQMASGSRAIIDTIEMPVKSVVQIRSAVESYKKSFAFFLEPVELDDPSEMLGAIAEAGAGAKIRTGGVVSGSVPSTAAVVRFIDRCAKLGIHFKATAGLHHAVRGSYPLTYATNAPKGEMFGYLNVFLAASFYRAGLPEPALARLLEESDASSMSFDEKGAWWRGNLATVEQLAATRSSLAVSFGSCSFLEPVEEARQLHLI